MRPKTFDRIFGTFDLETIGLGGAYADGFTWEGPGTEPERHLCVESLFKSLLNPDRGRTPNGNESHRSYEWFAHNGAKYDFTYLAKRIRDYALENGLSVETCQQGTKIIRLVIPTPDGKVKISDSLPLLMGSLERVSKAFAPEFAKAGHCPMHDFTEGGEYDPECDVCVDYARQDVIALWHTYQNHRVEFIRLFGVEPGLTTGSSAVKAWISTLPRGNVYWRQSPRKERWLRNFCTGAYITPGVTSAELEPEPGEDYAAITADRSAAFAAAMLEGNYPTDTGAWVFEHDPEAAYAFYQCEAECPEGRAPLIPLTNSDGDKAWATGRGIAYVTSEQYEYAIQRGYRLKVTRGLVFDRVENLFDEFIKKCENLEYPPDGSDADPAVKAIVKNMRNSLNGKFNVREEQDRIYIGVAPADDAKARPMIDEDTGQRMPFYTKREPVEAPYCQPGWYAITVSRQQIEDLRLVELCDPAERFKCDTDSFTTTPGRMRDLVDSGALTIGPGYGAYKFEHLWITHQSLGPKNYRGTELVAGVERYSANCKGIPAKLLKDDPVFREAHRRAGEGEKVQISFDSLRSLLEMIEKGLEIPGIRRVRSIGMPDTVNGWDYDRATKTFSPKHFI